jgi:hypothetical protein
MGINKLLNVHLLTNQLLNRPSLYNILVKKASMTIVFTFNSKYEPAFTCRYTVLPVNSH